MGSRIIYFEGTQIENEFWSWLKGVPEVILSEFPKTVYGPLGQHGVEYGEDEDGDLFATIGFNLPEKMYAEIEDGTYGELQGIRILLESEEEPFHDPELRMILLDKGGFE